MKQIPFDRLMDWILTEYKEHGTIFGIDKSKFYKTSGQKTLPIFGEALETPFGPAAGPHTQLAQNIVTSYITGSRFFEIKTVQTLDGEDLPVSKPCINAQDEGFNVEWSTELYVNEAFEEYVKGYIAINVLSKELGMGGTGFVFNMSVGYDYEGITSKKINTYIEGLKDASETDIFKECKKYLLDNLTNFKNVDKTFIDGISPTICRSITLSTLHGCPANEIEKISNYLLTEKKLNTFIKCNPTILGYDHAREICDRMGYTHLAFDDHHFKNDLQYDLAVEMIKRLKDTAKAQGLEFGVKLTNTFPVQIQNGELPGEEMYMSGRSLYPLSINAAYKLAKAFDGDLRISYSGGGDYFNIDKIFDTGIWPITIATTVLKPGGYSRMQQIADKLEQADFKPFSGLDLPKLQALAEGIDPNHVKQKRPVTSRKIEQEVPLIDCYISPCKNGCPINQDVPEYIRLVGQKDYLGALKVITERNPMPFTTGTICAHPCMDKCTRIDYDEPVYIRQEKLVAAEKAYDQLVSEINPSEAKKALKVAVIGAGPAGLAAAYFLGKNGYDVTVFEKRDILGGTVAAVIPDFRISEAAYQKDIELVKKYGAKFITGASPDFNVKNLFEQGYKYIFIATGASKESSLKLDETDKQPLNVISFLESLKKGEVINLGKNVAVIGAGNSAMDAARAAKRVPGVENVYIIYRRTKALAPAEREEIILALEDGVKFCELTTPMSHKNGVLTCQKMELGEKDASGRRKPVPIKGEFLELNIDTIIGATGESVETSVLESNGLAIESGKVKYNSETGETNVPNVFIGGDAAYGPSTIVKAMSSGLKFAAVLMEREGESLDIQDFTGQLNNDKIICDKKAVLCNTKPAGCEHERCLECGYVCNICMEVCPNRANVVINVPGLKMPQILHLDPLCNECGNCASFCPYDSAPYKEKFTYFNSLDDFENSEQVGFVILDWDNKKVNVRFAGKITTTFLDECHKDIPCQLYSFMKTFVDNYSYML